MTNSSRKETKQEPQPQYSNMSDLEYHGPFKYETFLEFIKKHNKEWKKIENQSKLPVESSYQCLGKQNVFEANERRACLFRNVCYQRETKEIVYFKAVDRPVFYDRTKGPQMSFDQDGNKFIQLAALWFFPDYLTPKIHKGPFPSDKESVYLEQTHFYWTNNMPDFNFGHFVFEELGAIHLTMQRFMVKDKKKTVVMNMRGHPASPLYDKFVNAFLPAITDQPMQDMTKYLDSFGKEFVCFKRLIVGGFQRFFLSYTDSFNEGKEPLLFEFRNDILRHYGLDPNARPRRDRILVNIKGESAFLSVKGRTRFRTIANVDQMTQHLRERYPKIQVNAIDLSKLSMKQQLQEMLQTTIFISHPGGSSMILPFIAVGSYAILMDYWVNLKDKDSYLFNYQDGDSASMEVSFWNLFPHFKKMYYQIYDPRIDTEWDLEAHKSYRDDASTVVNLDRIEFMVNEALHHYHLEEL